MKTNKFFANAASRMLALAAVVVMMSVAFTSCSKDNDTPEVPQPETFPNIVMLDGKVMPVVSAEYESSTTPGAFRLFLNLSQDGKTYVMLCGNTALHIGKDINLAMKESEGVSEHWTVGYWDADINGWFFQTNGAPSSVNPLFITGMLRIDGNPLGGEVSVSLKKGKITDSVNGDGKEHTININWKGTPKKL